jgi:hypothetical protein
MWWAVVNAVVNLRVAQNEGNFLTSWETVSFSGRTLLYEISFSFVISWFSVFSVSPVFLSVSTSFLITFPFRPHFVSWFFIYFLFPLVLFLFFQTSRSFVPSRVSVYNRIHELNTVLERAPLIARTLPTTRIAVPSRAALPRKTNNSLTGVGTGFRLHDK